MGRRRAGWPQGIAPLGPPGPSFVSPRLPNHVRNPRTKQPCNTRRVACQAAHAWSRLTRSFRAGFDSLRGSRREVGTNLARSCSGDVSILTTTRPRVRIHGSGNRAAPARPLVGANSLPRHPTSTDQDRFDGQQRRRQGKRKTRTKPSPKRIRKAMASSTRLKPSRRTRKRKRTKIRPRPRRAPRPPRWPRKKSPRLHPGPRPIPGSRCSRSFTASSCPAARCATASRC